jgi:hypothetical protein
MFLDDYTRNSAPDCNLEKNLHPHVNTPQASAAKGSFTVRPFDSPNAHTHPVCDSGFPSLYRPSPRGTSSKSKIQQRAKHAANGDTNWLDYSPLTKQFTPGFVFRPAIPKFRLPVRTKTYLPEHFDSLWRVTSAMNPQPGSPQGWGTADSNTKCNKSPIGDSCIWRRPTHTWMFRNGH